jgi:hypothetical protein
VAQQITIDIVAETQKLQAGVATANKQLGTVEDGLKGLAATAIATASAFVLREGVTFLKQGIDEAKEAQQTMREATTTFGEGSKALEQITAEATKFGNALAVDNDTIIQLATQLGSRLPKEAQALSAQLVNTFFDVEAFTGGAVKAEAITSKLGKAFADGELRAGELEKIFPALTAKTYEQAEALSKAGKNTEALTLLIGESQKAYGDAAEKNVTSSQKFEVALANLKETVGTKLLPFVEKLVDTATKLIDKFATLSPTTQNVILGFTGVVAIGGPLLTFLANAKTALITLTGIQGATKIATDLTTGAIAGQTVATNVATGATNRLKIALASTGIGLLIVAIGTLIANFDKVKETVSKLIGYLSNAFEPVKRAIESVIGRIKDLIPDWLKKLLGIDGAKVTVNAPNIVGGSGVNSGLNTVSSSNLPFGGNIKTGSNAQTKDKVVIPTITETGKTLKETANALDKASKSNTVAVERSAASIQALANSFRQKEAADEEKVKQARLDQLRLFEALEEQRFANAATYNISVQTLQPTQAAGQAIVESIKEFTNRGGNFFRATQVAI